MTANGPVGPPGLPAVTTSSEQAALWAPITQWLVDLLAAGARISALHLSGGKEVLLDTNKKMEVVGPLLMCHTVDKPEYRSAFHIEGIIGVRFRA